MYRVREIFTFQIKIRLNKWLICAILTRVLVHVAKTCSIYSPNSNTEKLGEQIFTADAIPYAFPFVIKLLKLLNLFRTLIFVVVRNPFFITDI